jgi:hypothetical protein
VLPAWSQVLIVHEAKGYSRAAHAAAMQQLLRWAARRSGLSSTSSVPVPVHGCSDNLEQDMAPYRAVLQQQSATAGDQGSARGSEGL